MVERSYPKHPMPGVGAVIVREGKVLLIRRGSEPLKGKWSLPGGLIELGETARQAVAREVEEETGLEVTSATGIETVDRIVRDDEGAIEYHYVLLDYLCQVSEGKARAGSDAEEIVWADERKAASLGVGESALGVIRKGLRMTLDAIDEIDAKR